ncbi:hypothetical protein [Streptomyces sp. NPDC002491]
MNEQDTVRDLLGHAVDTVEPPVARSSESVFARAAALRRRRRVAVTGAVAVVVAGGVVLGTGVLPGGTGGQNATGSGVGSSGARAGTAGFAKLLPAGVGRVREVDMTKLLGVRTSATTKKGTGPHDGDYAVARDGGVGYVTVRLHGKAVVTGPSTCADAAVFEWMTDCTSEKAPGVGLLSIWGVSGAKADKESDSWLEARLVRDDGTVLCVQDWTGIHGAGKEGPPLRTYPLTKAQLRQLALNPALLP